MISLYELNTCRGMTDINSGAQHQRRQQTAYMSIWLNCYHIWAIVGPNYYLSVSKKNQ